MRSDYFNPMKLPKYREMTWYKENRRKDKTSLSLGKVLFVDEAYTLTLRPQKDSEKETIESIIRYMLLSNGSVQHPVFQICWLEWKYGGMPRYEHWVTMED